VRYVALGDSYTIGTSVRPVARWPDQLVAALGPEEPALHLVANLAVDGYTSADLIRDELPALEVLDPEFATVLIGVNDLPTVEPSVPAHETGPARWTAGPATSPMGRPESYPTTTWTGRRLCACHATRSSWERRSAARRASRPGQPRLPYPSDPS
jgi:lysophospholipase L1-like esterase